MEEGLNAAAQIGDDRIQKRTQGYVVREGFTHGSAEQRVQWFRRGMENVDLKQCDSFSQVPYREFLYNSAARWNYIKNTKEAVRLLCACGKFVFLDLAAQTDGLQKQMKNGKSR